MDFGCNVSTHHWQVNISYVIMMSMLKHEDNDDDNHGDQVEIMLSMTMIMLVIMFQKHDAYYDDGMMTRWRRRRWRQRRWWSFWNEVCVLFFHFWVWTFILGFYIHLESAPTLVTKFVLTPHDLSHNPSGLRTFFTTPWDNFAPTLGTHVPTPSGLRTLATNPWDFRPNPLGGSS